MRKRLNEYPYADAINAMHVYEVGARKDKLGVDLISDALPFGRLWYAKPDAASNAVLWAKSRKRQVD